MLFHDYFTSAEYAALSPRAVKALLDLYCQFRGSNNGDLCAAWTIMSKRGWTSKDQLDKALRELLETGWIIVTRMGGNRVARLYAVSFLGIDTCGGKLDVAPNPVPSQLWRKVNGSDPLANSAPRRAGRSVPPHGSKDSVENELRPATRVKTPPLVQNL
jgi:hypothetical protein